MKMLDGLLQNQDTFSLCILMLISCIVCKVKGLLCYEGVQLPPIA